MVVMDISEFLNCLVKLLFSLVFMQVGALVFQCVEIPFHRRIVIGTSGSAHALCHVYGLTEFREGLGGVL